MDLRFYFDFALTPPDSCWTFRAEGQQRHFRNFPRVFHVLTVRDAVRGSVFYFLPLVTAMELPLCPQREVLYLEYLRHGDPPSPVHRRGSPRGEDSPWSRDFKTWYARQTRALSAHGSHASRTEPQTVSSDEDHPLASVQCTGQDVDG